MLVGIARDWESHEDTIIQTTELLSRSPVSVLLVHPKMEGLIKARKQSHSEEKARLYLGGDQKIVGLEGLGGSARSSIDMNGDAGSSSSEEIGI